MISNKASMSENDKVAQEDWFTRGKEDALMGRAKQPPETDPEQSSLYDLGYSEGSIQASLTEVTTHSANSPA